MFNFIGNSQTLALDSFVSLLRIRYPEWLQNYHFFGLKVRNTSCLVHGLMFPNMYKGHTTPTHFTRKESLRPTYVLCIILKHHLTQHHLTVRHLMFSFIIANLTFIIITKLAIAIKHLVFGTIIEDSKTTYEILN